MRKFGLISSVLVLSVLATPTNAVVDEDVSGLTRVASVNYGHGTHLEFARQNGKTYALAGSRDAPDAGLRIIDVTDPGSPRLVGATEAEPTKPSVKCVQGNNDIGVDPTGRWLVLTTDAQNTGNPGFAPGCAVPGTTTADPNWLRTVKDIALVDVGANLDGTGRSLENPRLYGTPKRPGAGSLQQSPWEPGLKGVHTAVFHPTRAIAYLSTQETPETGVDRAERTATGPLLYILNLEGPTPVVTSVGMPMVGDSPHDITFSPDGNRAYVSAVTASYILDTSDPLGPQLVTLVTDGAINIHHEAMLSANGRYLFVVDELAGALAAPQCPGGGVHIFDLSVEAAPVPVGAIFTNDTRLVYEQADIDHFVAHPESVLANEAPVCTAHEGTLSADTLSIAWYRSGVRLFDVSALNDPGIPSGAPVAALITETARARYNPAATDTWAAKMHPSVPGYVFLSDQVRGFEVYSID